jgi:hypothetical protein
MTVLDRPPYEAQTRPNSCWAACLKMWLMGEISTSYSQSQIIGAAGAFDVGPGGIDVDGLGSTIDSILSALTISMMWTKVQRRDDVPYIVPILDEVGYVYLAFQRSTGGGGHVHVLYGYNENGYLALDPDPKVGPVLTSERQYFGKFPAFVGWRMTSSTPGYGYTGRPPWDYCP